MSNIDNVDINKKVRPFKGTWTSLLPLLSAPPPPKKFFFGGGGANNLVIWVIKHVQWKCYMCGVHFALINSYVV